MEKVSSDYEILEFAIYREMEAYNFYLAMASRVENIKIQKVFEELAIEESEHKAKLVLEIIKTGRTYEAKEVPPRTVSEYIMTEEPGQLDMDYKDVLMLGMEKEEASFRTYVNLIANVHDEHSREVLLELAEEEVKHKMRFQSEYDMMLSKA